MEEVPNVLQQGQPLSETPIPATPQNHEPQQHHKKSKIFFLMLTLLVICLLILFAPMPHYNATNAICKPNQTNCPTKGLSFGLSLWNTVFAKLTSNSSSSIKMVPTKILSPSHTSDTTADWKTATSSYGYSFKYPSALNLKIGKDVTSFAYDIQLDNSKYNLSICKPNLCELPSLDRDPLSMVKESINITPALTLDGHKAYRIRGQLQNPDSSTLYHIIEVIDLSDDKKMQIEANALSDTTSESLDTIFNQILSTFKFTSTKNTSVDTSDWKTYTTTSGKFTIQYPPNWTMNETHYAGNSEPPDPNAATEVTLLGKEGEVDLKWGNGGFGGGCDVKDHKNVQLKNVAVDACTDEQTYWGGISRPDSKLPAFEANASATDLPIAAQTITKIFSTLSFQ